MEAEPPEARTLVSLSDDAVSHILSCASVTSLLDFKAVSHRFLSLGRRALTADQRFAAARAIWAGPPPRARSGFVLADLPLLFVPRAAALSPIGLSPMPHHLFHVRRARVKQSPSTTMMANAA